MIIINGIKNMLEREGGRKAKGEGTGKAMKEEMVT